MLMPLAEKYASTSTYAYVLNNPINGIDPDGMQRRSVGDLDIENRVAYATSQQLFNLAVAGGEPWAIQQLELKNFISRIAREDLEKAGGAIC